MQPRAPECGLIEGPVSKNKNKIEFQIEFSDNHLL